MGRQQRPVFVLPLDALIAQCAMLVQVAFIAYGGISCTTLVLCLSIKCILFG